MLHDWRDGQTAAATPAGRAQVLGCSLDRVRLADAVELVSRWVDDPTTPRLAVAINAAKAERMRRDASLRVMAAKADLVFADGIGVVWASRAAQDPLPERVAGVDLCTALLRRTARRGWRPYLLGGSPTVSVALRQRLVGWGVDIAGARHGYWPALGEAEVVADIANARPDLLFVALGSPRQEAFLLRWRDALRVPFAMGVGGSFDVLAGRAVRAPQAVRDRGLEWAWRLSGDPRRLLERRSLDAARYALRIGRLKLRSLRS